MSNIERTQKDTKLIDGAYTLGSNGFFGSNVLLNFICKKTDRLASGIFMVTESFQKDDPLRASLRRRSLELLHALFALKRGNVSSVLALIGEIEALISIAAQTGNLSQDNKYILDSEYKKLAALVVERSDKLFEDTRSDLAVEEVFKEDLEGAFAEFSMPAPSISKRHIDVSIGHKNPRSNLFDRGEQSSFSPRQGQILSIIDARGSVSIRDVAGVIKDCSEKTIQRELLSMVSAGVLKKEGERRWSTYRRA